MTNDKIRRLLERAAAGDDIDQLMAEIAARDRTARAHQHLADLIRDDDDMTGQDNEDRINHAADDLICARNNELRIRDPDAYAEQLHMGLL